MSGTADWQQSGKYQSAGDAIVDSTDWAHDGYAQPEQTQVIKIRCIPPVRSKSSERITGSKKCLKEFDGVYEKDETFCPSSVLGEIEVIDIYDMQQLRYVILKSEWRAPTHLHR